MPNYRIAELHFGELVLPSGTWRWFPIRLMSLPENVCCLQYLIFADLEVAGATMRVRIPAEIDDLTPEQVSEFAAHPDERNVPTSSGMFRIDPPAEGESDPMWRVSGPGNIRFSTDIDVEVPLGHIGHERIVQIAELC